MSRFDLLGRTAAVAILCLAGCGQDVENHRAGATPAATKGLDAEPYLSRRASFRTSLVRNAPAPQPWTNDPLPDGVTGIEYQSEGRRLKAWLFLPRLAEKETRPALVYLHGGFAFGADDFADCQPFKDAGFVVLCPTFRGENGNPGNCQMMLGEVDDAAAAVRWLASHEHVDRSRLFVFGHSSGGVMSAVLSLYDDLPVVHTGSAGGLYGPNVFDGFAQIVPFDLRNPQERQVRVLVGNVRWMKRPHFAFTGKQDTNMRAEDARREAADSHAPLTVIELPGDHHSSLSAAMRGYLQIVLEKK